MNTKVHSDIKSDNWIETFFPDRLRPYAYLARLDRPIGVWLLLLPGWWSIVMASGGAFAMNKNDWSIFSLFALGAVIMRAAGCVVNDLWDRKIDKDVGRTSSRPLATGEVTVRQAMIFLFLLLFAGLLILIQMNIVTVLLGILSLPLIFIYPLMKRWTWWPQAFLGLVFNFGALMGWSAITGILEIPALLLYIAGILWTLGYDTIYAHQDKEDDILVGIKSTALKFGDRSKDWVTGFFSASWVCVVLACVFAMKFYVMILLVPAALHLYWQMKEWRVDDEASSLTVFKANMDYGLLIMVALLLGAP